ncbi:muramoyltetrapeptide carboxypeptidase [Herbaspirillum sp. alder98]|uniref:muramoyltetrapeptide carboxypeptidase n=1 Tax=Herbaspirillum sp. alder98 TaxID=2913096 RepID=UPI001CD8904E|nr:muramoyltetrapeptide carboxypeptidase [Herbaspirillum sp. alder98]MCA1323619.1 muramoyltetrapeptide carboxypeptidase [Herbaspirillum sp. alder98]
MTLSADSIDTLVPPGTHVAIVAPGGYAPDPAAVERGVALLESMGCTVTNHYRHDQRYLRFGASDAARAAQLMEAAADPQVQVILALRGSYGVSRILPLLDLDALAASGKLLVGYSDITALHLAWLKAGGVSFAGPMLNGDFGAVEPQWGALQQFWRTLGSPQVTIHSHSGGSPGDRSTDSGSPALQCEGVLWGGNLAMVAHLVGSPWMPQVDGGILFLEDVNEHPFRVERMLLQLEAAGILARQKAIVLGDFASYRLAEIDNGYDFAEMLAFLRGRFATPIVTGLPFGHVRDLVTLPVGGHAALDSRGADGFSMTLSAYPTLAATAR